MKHINKKMKVAKIITTSFIPREIRENSILCGNPLGYFSHSQNFSTRESIIELLRFNVAEEKKCDPGCDTDVIIVNNDTGWIPGRDYLDSVDRMKLKHGVIRVLHRENFGRSFGGYNYAFSRLSDEYDYFIFTEDDILIVTDQYASIGVKEFNSTQNCGFVAFQALSNKSHHNLSKAQTLHAHGGVGISSANILNKVVRNHGFLPHSTKDESQKYTDIIKNGEIDFTNKIYQLGYKLISMPKDIKLYNFAYDKMRGFELNRYATIGEKALFKFKSLFYRIKVMLNLA